MRATLPSKIHLSRSIVTLLGLAVATAVASPVASANEFILENNSNETVHVAVGHFKPGVGNVDHGWYSIPVGQSRVLYNGNDDQISIHITSGPERREGRPHTFLGTVNRYTCNERFVRENTDTPGNIKLMWGTNLERIYFQDKNVNLPPGWFDTRYYIVNANQKFTVVP